MIEEYIPEGYENRVSRNYLHEILQMPDRKIRQMIEEAQDKGILIASYDGGYFRRRDERDDPYIEDYIGKEDQRCYSILHKKKRLHEAWNKIHPERRKKDRQIPGQMSMFEV